jgi:hypothetical protein
MNPSDPSPRAGGPVVDDDAFAASLQALLRKGEDDLDFTTTARLSAARARAVAQARTPRVRWPWAAAIPTACAAAVAAWMISPFGSLPFAPGHAAHAQLAAAAPIEVLELLGTDEAPVADEELDFAQWLDQQSAAPAATAPDQNSI